jgi:glycosyltransferase involved in cell wall biosynthesis
MLGSNVASQMSVTATALRRIGVDVDSAVYETNPYASAAGLRNFAVQRSRRERMRAGYLSTSWSWAVATGIRNADVVHWNYAIPVWPKAFDVRLTHWLRRPGAVEFWGSDVRIAELAERDNPYYARRGPGYEYQANETKTASYARQDEFGQNGVTTCFAPPWFERYIKPGLFKRVHDSFLRIDPREFPVSLPANRRPIIAHAPSARAAKGTEAVEQALQRLRDRFDFEYVVLHGVSRDRVLEHVRTCDLFLDQFVIGEYGMASIEAMAFGKPVVCYLRPDVIERSAPGLPIINATQDELYDRVADLLSDRDRLRQIGEASRRYVEMHHDADAYARRLVPLYEQMIQEAQ